MNSNVALICVDLQNDFMPGGSLPVKDGDQIIPIINDILPYFKTVIFTKDWHPSDSRTFASQHDGYNVFDQKSGNTLWPDHCVQDTPGADLHSDIQYGQIFGDFYIFKKGTDKYKEAYSGFDGTELTEFLNERGINTVYICGLALNFCVISTAIDAVKNEFNTIIILDASKAINEDILTSISNIHRANIKTVSSFSLIS